MKNRTIVFGTTGAIVLGIGANVAWDLLKPLTRFLFEVTLNLSILGMDRFKDGMYQQIAKGFHESASLDVFIFTHIIFLVFFLAMTLLLFVLRKILIDSYNNKSFFVDKIISFPKKLYKSNLFIWLLVFYALFISTTTVLVSVREVYVNNAMTHFEQLSQIVRPHTSVEQDILYKSSFSQIQNRDDYILIINELKKVAIEEQLSIPKFSFTF